MHIPSNAAPIQLSTEIEIAAPAHLVWNLIADHRFDERWRRGVRSMVSTPPGTISKAGVSTSEVIRVAGRTYRNDGVVRSVDVGVGFTWETTSGARASGSRSVTPTTDEGCVVRLTLHVWPAGFDRVLALIVRRVLARNLRRDAERLRTIAEEAVAVTESPNRTGNR